MTNAIITKPASTANETVAATNNSKVVIYPNGDFTNYNYVTKEQLESYLEIFYNS